MGGGGSRYFPRRSAGLARELQQAQADAERQEADVVINDYLRSLLVKLNARDVDKINEHLDILTAALDEKVDIDRLLFGGSVAKHTYVDGLSDVDALVVLDSAVHGQDSPQQLIDRFASILRTKLTKAKIETIEKGQMAVTVTYRDGTEIQLLPALQREGQISVPHAAANAWKAVDPAAFRDKLTAANDRLSKMLVPTIKLFKAAIAGLPEQQRVSGYHAETLCASALENYSGPSSFRHMLIHAFELGAKKVLSPIADITNQSRNVDADLGPADSAQRLVVREGFESIARRLKNHDTVEAWRSCIDPENR